MGAAHGRFLPDLVGTAHVERVLRYGTDEEAARLRLVAASYVAAYRHLLTYCAHPYARGTERALAECWDAAITQTPNWPRGEDAPPPERSR